MLTRMSKYIYIGILLLVIVLCFSVFSNAEEKRLKIGLTSQGFASAYSTLANKGAEDEAKLLGVDLILVDGQFSSDIQVSQIENLLAQKCDLIIIHPNNAKALGAKAQWVQSMGVPVIALSMSLDPPSAGFVGHDEGAGAMEVMELLAKRLEYKGKILAIQGLPGTSAKIDDDKAVDYIIKKYPDIELLDSKPADWDMSKAYTLMQNFLQAYPEIDGVFTYCADMAVGAIGAIKASGREGIILVSQSGSKEELALIREGSQYATMALDPYSMGRNAVFMAVFMLKQENKDLWRQMKAQIYLQPQPVTKENVEEFEGF